MSETIETPPQVNPAEVAAFLAGDGTVKLDLDPAAQVELGIGNAQETPAAPRQTAPPVDVPADSVFMPPPPTRNDFAYWSMEAPTLGEVTVTENEKTLFLKSVLNDVPLTWDISSPGLDIPVTLRSRTNFETDVVFRAIYEDQDSKDVLDTAALGSRIQQYCACVQLLKLNGVATSNLQLSPTKPLLEAVTELKEYFKAHVATMHAARWAMIVTTLRIFTIKEKLCNDNLVNRNFWQPVGTA